MPTIKLSFWLKLVVINSFICCIAVAEILLEIVFLPSTCPGLAWCGGHWYMCINIKMSVCKPFGDVVSYGDEKITNIICGGPP